MLNFTKTVSCSVIGTAQQIDTKLMHRFEKFRKNLLVTFYSMEAFIFLTHELKQGKSSVWGFLQCKSLKSHQKSQTLPCAYQVILRKFSLFSDKKIAGLRYMTCQSLKNHLGQVNLCFSSNYCIEFVCDHNEARD